MRDPLLKPTTSLSVLIPACNEQRLVEPSLNALRVLGEGSFLERAKVIAVDESASLFRLESAWHEAAN